MTFRHILVPTDGSARSRKAVATAARLARALGARISLLHVVRQGVPTLFSGDRMYASAVLGRRGRERIRRAAAAVLRRAATQVRSAGVAVAGLKRVSPEPWQAILRTARARRCDLILMASHGRRGLSALVLGSETARVLTHSKVPVLVVR